MRVLIAHVAYRVAGGEDAVVETEARLLREAGVDVETACFDSAEFDRLSPRVRVTIGLSLSDHEYGRSLIAEAIEKHAPDVVHFHNLYPLLGPGAVSAARRLGCGVVQTIHNYRLSCLAGTHLNQGKSCELCSPLHRQPGILRGCYRGSRLQSWSLAKALDAHWLSAISGRGAHATIFLSESMRDRYVRAGLPIEATVVKPNSVEPGNPAVREPNEVLYVGRLSAEKGIRELVDAWPASAPTLNVAGAGPLEEDIGRRAGANVRLLGRVEPARVRSLMRESRVVVMPSLCLEGQPLTMLESLSEGVPVVGFAGTAIADAVGTVFPQAIARSGDFVKFVAAVKREFEADFRSSQERAIGLYESHFANRLNQEALTEIYQRVLEQRGNI